MRPLHTYSNAGAPRLKPARLSQQQADTNVRFSHAAQQQDTNGPRAGPPSALTRSASPVQQITPDDVMPLTQPSAEDTSDRPVTSRSSSSSRLPPALSSSSSSRLDAAPQATATSSPSNSSNSNSGTSSSSNIRSRSGSAARGRSHTAVVDARTASPSPRLVATAVRDPPPSLELSDHSTSDTRREVNSLSPTRDYPSPSSNMAPIIDDIFSVAGTNDNSASHVPASVSSSTIGTAADASEHTAPLNSTASRQTSSLPRSQRSSNSDAATTSASKHPLPRSSSQPTVDSPQPTSTVRRNARSMSSKRENQSTDIDHSNSPSTSSNSSRAHKPDSRRQSGQSSLRRLVEHDIYRAMNGLRLDSRRDVSAYEILPCF